jgi:DNA repair photolyase
MKTKINKATASAVESSQERKTGFGEWARWSRNIGVGCSHNCVYCVQRRYGLQFRGVNSREEWANEKLKEPPKIRKFQGTVMMPITPFYLPVVQSQLVALLKAGNQVLVVSKPHLECIRKLCAALAPYKQ